MKQYFLLILILLLTLLTSISGDEEFCKLDGNSDGCSEEDANERRDLLKRYSPVELGPDTCFRAAVFEHRATDFDDLTEGVETNMKVFEEVATIAAQHGAQIIVFPEDGLFMPKANKMDILLRDVPDPAMLGESDSNPCLKSERFEKNEILTRLSCVARANNLYLVANFGTKESCSKGTKIGNSTCPDKGFLAFNTNVIFDSSGNYIKRYRKFNTYIENFDKALSLENVFFDTPFGRFGVFTCFDMIFERPAVELVERFHIDTALFPTWWYDELPLLSAIQYQDGWSLTNKVNLLASNLLIPRLGSVGSGIYSGENSLYTSANNSKSRLLIASLPSNRENAPKCQFDPETIEIKTSEPKEEYKNAHYKLLQSDSFFTPTKREDTKVLCNGAICCTIEYRVSASYSTNLMNKLLFIVRDGNRPGRFEWREQVCALATLLEPIEMNKLEQTKFSTAGIVGFDQLHLSGNFNSKYVYPILAHNVSVLVERSKRQYYCDRTQLDKGAQFKCKLSLDSVTKAILGDPIEPIYSIGLYGRLYENDKHL